MFMSPDIANIGRLPTVTILCDEETAITPLDHAGLYAINVRDTLCCAMAAPQTDRGRYAYVMCLRAGMDNECCDGGNDLYIPAFPGCLCSFLNGDCMMHERIKSDWPTGSDADFLFWKWIIIARIRNNNAGGGTRKS